MKYILTCMAILLLTIPAYGKNNGNKNKNKHDSDYEYQHESKSQKKNKQKKVKKHNKDLPPGLQKKAAQGKELPPGWQKKIRKGHKIDDDLYRHMKAVDPQTLRSLPRLRSGESYREISNEVVKIKNSSREILKVIEKSSLLPPPPPYPFF